MSAQRQHLNTAYLVALWRLGCFEAAYQTHLLDPTAAQPGQAYEEFFGDFSRIAADFDRAAELRPMPGDAVMLGPAFEGAYWEPERRAIAVLNGTLGEPADEYLLTCRAQEGGAFRSGSEVSCSGGPSFQARAADMRFLGTREVEFWRWLDRPRAGGRDRYRLVVPLWELLRHPDMPQTAAEESQAQTCSST